MKSARSKLSSLVAETSADHGLSMGELAEVVTAVAAEYVGYARQAEADTAKIIRRLEERRRSR